MKRVLWISRHQMTGPQLADLETVLGDTVELLPWTDTVERVEVLLPQVEAADAVAAVLPTDLLARLLPCCGHRPLLQTVAHRVATGNVRTLADGRQEPEFRFIYGGWQQICRLELETRLLSWRSPEA